MTITTLITVNAVLAAVVLYGIAFLLAHSVRHDRRHSLGHLRSLRAAEPARERDRIAA
jgi:hypothetical protein